MPEVDRKAEAYFSFLCEVLSVFLENRSDIEVLHSLFEKEIDKLDNTFAGFLRLWILRESKQPNLELDNIQVLAAIVNDLCKALREFTRNKQNNLEIAICAYETLLEAHLLNLPKYFLAIVLNNLSAAYCERKLGNPNENLRWAIESGEHALNLINPEEFPEDWAMIQDSLGSAYCKQGKFKKAVDAYNLASKVYSSGGFSREWAGTQTNLGLTYSYQGELAQAVQAYTEALTVYRNIHDLHNYNLVKRNLGSTYRKQGEFDKAIEVYKEALEYYELERFPEDWAQIQSDLGNIYFDDKKPRQAIKHYQKARNIFSPQASPADSFIVSQNLGNAAFAQGFWEEAIQGYSCAIPAVETLRVSAYPDEERQEIFQQSLHVYSNIIQAFIKLGKVEAALEYAERTHCKRLVDLVASVALHEKDSALPEVKVLLEKFNSLQQQIDQERAQHFSSKSRTKLNPSTGRASDRPYSQRVAFLEKEKYNVWKKLRKYDPVLASQIKIESQGKRISNAIDRRVVRPEGVVAKQRQEV